MLAKVFKSGNSQAVRIPSEYKLDVSEVEIIKQGDDLILRPIARDLTRAFKLLTDLPDDFMDQGREDEPPQERETFNG